VVVGDAEQAVVGNDDLGVDLVLQGLDPAFRLHRPAAALEAERAGHDRDGERSEAFGYLGDDRRRTSARAPAFAGGDEHHVGAAERLLDVLAVIGRGLSADLGIAARAQAPCQLSTNVKLYLS